MSPALLNKFENGPFSTKESRVAAISAAADIKNIEDQAEIPTAFDKLVDDIKAILGPNRDLKSEDVDADLLQQVLRAYDSDQSEWEKYSFVDLSRHYTRNLVDDINANANLILMTWTPGKSSLVHDHTKSHCIMRILQGHLRETQYEFPEPGATGPLEVKQITDFKSGDVAYINDNLGIHKVENADADNVSISLHLYTPRYIETRGCNTFNPKTGKSNHVSLAAYYSENGKKTSGSKGADSCSPPSSSAPAA